MAGTWRISTGRTFAACDPELFDQLKQIVESNRRNVAEIECRRLLDNAVFFADMVGSGPRRETWLESALAATANCDAVFLDPDNGLKIASCDRASRAAGKYIYLDEIAAFAKRRQTLVIYHHLCRRGSHVEQIRHRARQLEQFGELTALRFRSYSARAYFLISNQKLSTDAFLATPWRNHFDRVL